MSVVKSLSTMLVLRFRNSVLQLFLVVLHDFTQLLEQQATIDQYAEWASKLVDSCIKVRNFVELKPSVCTGTPYPCL